MEYTEEMRNTVILVDELDNQIGLEEKISAHKNAHLHRAFSILISNSKGEALLQQRALTKYHGGGLWSNACCGHPMPGESLEHAIHRRLQEEMGFDCELTKRTTFIYKTPISNGLTEHEYLHVYDGQYEGEMIPNPEEVSDIKWIAIQDLEQGMKKSPTTYTPWFHLSAQKLLFQKHA